MKLGKVEMFPIEKIVFKTCAGAAGVFMILSPMLPWFHSAQKGSFNLFTIATTGNHIGTIVVGVISLGIGFAALIILKLKRLAMFALFLGAGIWVIFAGYPMANHLLSTTKSVSSNNSAITQCVSHGALPGSYSLANLTATPNAACQQEINSATHAISTTAPVILHDAQNVTTSLQPKIGSSFYVLEGLAAVLVVVGSIAVFI